MRLVILCGGSGSRLWPESRENLPKQFISIFDQKSLLDLTIERVLHFKTNIKPIFICNKKHGFLVKRTLQKYNLKANIFLEPEGKSTCAAIYLAAKYSLTTDNLLIMPSDHLISDNKKFVKDILKIQKQNISDNWITLGVKPTKPSDAYGYIEVIKNNTNNLFKVKNFIEKPSKEVASNLILNENFFWNSGIFLGNAAMIISSIKEHASKIAKHCDHAFNEIEINKQTDEIFFSSTSFSKIPSETIDYAVMEHEKNIKLYPLSVNWNDVGSWDAVAEINETNNLNEKIIEIDSYNNFIRSEKRTIATIGVQDLIVVDSDNATLIAKKHQSEKVKLIVSKILKKKFVEAIEHTFENRPWGKFENLYIDNHCKVKRITVSSQKRLSLQYHNFRSEHWLIVYGIAKIHLDGKKLTLSAGQSIDIPIRSHHYVENKTKDDLIIIETQLGTYFGEDDIIRLEDPYNR